MESKSSKIGNLAEMQLMLEATQKGHIVSKPYGDHRYDLVIDSGKNLKRVQVKAANRSQNISYYNGKKYSYGTYPVDLGQGYTSAEIDILAIYLIDDKKWIFIPSYGLPFKTGVTRFSVLRDNAWYSKYVNSWEIF